MLARPTIEIEFGDVMGSILGNQLQICRGCDMIRSGCTAARLVKGASSAALEYMARYSLRDIIEHQ